MVNTATNFTIFADSSETHDSLVDRLFSALWLISLGLVFLLNSLGILPWSVWVTFGLTIAQIWPIFFVLVGLSILIGQSTVGKIINGVLWYGFMLIIFILAIGAPLNTKIDINSKDFPKSFIEEVFQIKN